MRKPFTPNPAYDDGMPTLTDRRSQQAQESRDQEPFRAGGGVDPKRIPVLDMFPPKGLDSGRRYGPLGLYLSPAEEEAVTKGWVDPHKTYEAAIRAAAIENALSSEAMGIPEEDVMAALGQSDMVNLPEHYARFKIEPIRFIVENNLNWFQGNITKYSSRGPHKHETPLEDIGKIIRYAEMWADYESGDPDWWLPRGHARRVTA